MARVLMVTCDAGGNVPPTVGIAAALRRRGHDVRILAHDTLRPDLEHFQMIEFTHARPWSSTTPKPGIAGAWEPLMMFSDSGIGIDTTEAIRALQPDVVVVDFMLSAALMAVRAEQVPLVVLGHTTYDWMTSAASTLWFAAATAKGQHVRACWKAADLMLIATDPILDAASGTGPSNAKWIGPVVERVPARPNDSDGPVLISLSSNSFNGVRGVLERVLEAAAGIDRRFVVTTGHALDPASFSPAPNVELHGFVPHDEVMPEASALVGHGGHATTMRALAHELPVIAVPLHPMVDQPRIGRMLVTNNLGTTVSRRAAPATIRSAINGVLGDSTIRTAVRSVADRFRASDPADAAVDLIEQIVNRRATIGRDDR